MSALEQMRRGMERLIELDGDTGYLTRRAMADNGRGLMVPSDGTVDVLPVVCRVSYQSGGVWPAKSDEAGLTIDTTPYVLARWDADVLMGDVLEWRGKKYTVGPVSRPQLGGGATCTQAPLTEVKV